MREEDIKLTRVRLIAISVLRVVTPREPEIKTRSVHRVWVDTLNLSKVRVSVWHVCLEPSRTDLRAVREVTDITRVDGLRVSVRTVPLENTVDLTTSISVLSAKLDVHREKSVRVNVRFVDPESTRRVQLQNARTARSGSTPRVMRTRIAVHVSLLIRESVLHIPRSASQLG